MEGGSSKDSLKRLVYFDIDIRCIDKEELDEHELKQFG
jgi:hypothetical protein